MTVQSVSVSVPPLLYRPPPPWKSAFPPVTFRPDSAADAVSSTKKTWLALLPLTVSRFSPVPVTVVAEQQGYRCGLDSRVVLQLPRPLGQFPRLASSSSARPEWSRTRSAAEMMSQSVV